MTAFGTYVRSALDAYIAAQERKAQRYINAALVSLDDQTLANLGYDREQLRRRSTSYIL